MFHRAVINRTHRHALKSTQQQHHIIIFTTSQYHNNGSSQNQHIKRRIGGNTLLNTTLYANHIQIRKEY